MTLREPKPGLMIRNVRKNAGFTQEALAEAIGCSKPQLSLMESGHRTVSLEWAGKIENALNIKDGRISSAVQWQAVPKEYRQSMTTARDLTDRLRQALAGKRPLAELREIVEQTTPNIDVPLPLRSRIPVINKVAAGYPTEFTDLDYPVSIADEYVECPDVTDPQAFAARVVGDSMEPDYYEGEIVVFSPLLPTTSGSDCFIRLERDNETTFKRIYIAADERTIRMQPLNQSYPPRFVDREEIGGMYAAAYVLRQVGGGNS